MDDNENTIYQKQYDTPKVTTQRETSSLKCLSDVFKKKPEQKGMSHTI